MARIPDYDYEGYVADLSAFDWDAAHDLKTFLEANRFPAANTLIETPASNVARREELKDKLAKIGMAQAQVNARIAELSNQTATDLKLN